MKEAFKADTGFKEENKASWKANTDYWLNNTLRQVEDTKAFFMPKLQELVHPGASVIDMGCGSGWILEFLLEMGIPCQYKGLDFTVEFLSHLERKYRDVPAATFEFVDLEEDIPENLQTSADIVFCAFAFFEMTALDIAFANAVKMLKPGGRLVILTIDPTYLALAVSKDMADFKAILKRYEDFENAGETMHFFQNIDLGDAESQSLRYASVLYSFADFFRQAKKHGMHLIDYDEIVKTSKYIPKIYQYMVFE